MCLLSDYERNYGKGILHPGVLSEGVRGSACLLMMLNSRWSTILVGDNGGK